MTIYELWLKPQEVDFSPSTRAEEVLQNVLTLCSTQKFSVPMDRELGLDFSFVDQPVNRARALFTQEVIMAVRQFEPRAEVTRVEFQGDYDGGVWPRVWLKIKEE